MKRGARDVDQWLLASFGSVAELRDARQVRVELEAWLEHRIVAALGAAARAVRCRRDLGQPHAAAARRRRDVARRRGRGRA